MGHTAPGAALQRVETSNQGGVHENHGGGGLMARRSLDPRADTLPSPGLPLEEAEQPQAEAGSFTAAAGSTPLEPSSPSHDQKLPLGCLDDDEILAYRDGRTSEEHRDRIHEHLDGCEACRNLVELFIRDSDAPSTGAPGAGMAMTFARGDVLAERYHIKRFIAHGGMGEVYEAFDSLGRKQVALKTVLCTASDNPRAMEKLIEEVRNAQRVTHPNVCRINELHQHPNPVPGGVPLHFLTMEFVEGEKLANRMRHGPMPLAEVMRVARQLLEGLRAAHRQGVLHLDFKSDNVMLRAGGELDVVIMDFGLSRALDSQSRMRTSERRQLAGSVHYMSPEQVQCSPNLGTTTDVYAFGVVLFEMLTGALPFEGDSPYTIMLQRLNKRPPAPSERVKGLPAALDAFVLGCMSREPRARFADAGAALDAFDRLAATAPSDREHAARKRLLAVAAMLVMGLLVALYLSEARSTATREQQALQPAVVAPATPAPPVAESVPQGAAPGSMAQPPVTPPAPVAERTAPRAEAGVAPAPLHRAGVLPSRREAPRASGAGAAPGGRSAGAEPPPSSKTISPSTAPVRPAAEPVPSAPPPARAEPVNPSKKPRQPALPGAPPGLF